MPWLFTTAVWPPDGACFYHKDWQRADKPNCGNKVFPEAASSPIAGFACAFVGVLLPDYALYGRRAGTSIETL
jgi:hypothetical protein